MGPGVHTPQCVQNLLDPFQHHSGPSNQGAHKLSEACRADLHQPRGRTRTTPGPCEVTSDQSFGLTCAPCPSPRAVTTQTRALASTSFSSGAADVLSNGFRRARVCPAGRTWPGGAWGHGQRWGVRSGHMQGLWGPSSARREGRPPDPAAQRGPNPRLSRQGSCAAFRGRGRQQPDGGTAAQRGSQGAKTSVIRK